MAVLLSGVRLAAAEAQMNAALLWAWVAQDHLLLLDACLQTVSALTRTNVAAGTRWLETCVLVKLVYSVLFSE